jgi:arabinogalactan oligomer/maltooligosaccharide transport system permease protein
LSLALLFAALCGVIGFWVMRLLAPTAPAYVSLLFGLAGLIVALNIIARRYQWIMPWYYLLPALLFLGTFTFFPIVLTVTLAFSDYAGVRNGELNLASNTAISNVSGRVITIADADVFNCDNLRNGCNGVRARIFAGGVFDTSGVALEGNVLELTEPVPEGRQATEVQLLLPSFGIRANFAVTEQAGTRVVLEREPPGDADLEEVRVQLDRVPVERLMVAENGNDITLDAPLPEGQIYESIARYNDFGLVGWRNFTVILEQARRGLLPVLSWNVTFAVTTMVLNTILGVFLAVLLNNPDLRFRNLYRTLLILPWALPNIITIQIWRSYLNSNYGAVNRLLALLDLPTFDWLGDAGAARAAVLLVNLWLGFPFIMTATLGALSAIPKELYEAAKIDGAGAWRRFTGVTAPLLRSALVPVTLTGFAFNFNNFNIIFLLTDGRPAVAGGIATAGATDIMISWAYKVAFQRELGLAYGLGSAISLAIFFITVAISLINFRVTGALKEEGV